MPRYSICLFLALTLGPSALSPAVAADPAPALDLVFASDDLTAAAQLPEGAELRLRAVPLEPARDLVLRRIRVFSPDARLTVRSPGGERLLPVPRNTYFGGGIAGEPGSRAFLAVRATGEIRGVISGAGRWWLLGKRPADAVAWLVEADAAAVAARTEGFRCEVDALDGVGLLEAVAVPGAPDTQGVGDALAATSAGTLPSFTARIAFETDEELLGLFGGDTDAAIDYVGDLVAYSSTLYDAEVDTNLLVSSVNLWQAADPWNQSSVSCRFFDFGRYWNDNNGGIDRTIAHFLSGRSANAGIAWIGVLCGGGFNSNISGYGCSLSPNVDNYGGGYGYSSGLDIDFDSGNPQVVWDFVVTAHEIGHNFDSPHTHCYNGVGGNPAPVDQCYNGECAVGCYCGSASLPCAGESGCGTLMSYCHLLAGGLGNIAPTFGLGHPFGVAPERVPTRMNAHVITRAADNPGCLDVILPQELVFTPANLDFGDVAVGSTSAPQDANLQNIGTAGATGVSFDPPGNGFDADTSDCLDTLGAGESCEVTVTFTPPAVGPAMAMLEAGSSEGASAILELDGNGANSLTPAALAVDSQSLASDGNGVFEPGETVEAAPSWYNHGEDPAFADGILSSFKGPAAAAYDIVSNGIGYTIPAGASSSCQDSEGGCYELRIQLTGPDRPAPHWDATIDEELTTGPSETLVQTWSLHVGDSFTDVPRSSLFYRPIETLLHVGVTGGCSAGAYCPGGSNTRSQMATFLLRAIQGAGYVPPACVEGEEDFGDVPFDSTFCPWIQELAGRGITSGCGGGDYCPDDSVSRAQMAVFLLKAAESAGYMPPACTGEFSDVDCPSLFADWIEELAARGVTSGCGGNPPAYCPTEPVARAQMAVFVTRSFGLALYGP